MDGNKNENHTIVWLVPVCRIFNLNILKIILHNKLWSSMSFPRRRNSCSQPVRTSFDRAFTLSGSLPLDFSLSLSLFYTFFCLLVRERARSHTCKSARRYQKASWKTIFMNNKYEKKKKSIVLLRYDGVGVFHSFGLYVMLSPLFNADQMSIDNLIVNNFFFISLKNCYYIRLF